MAVVPVWGGFHCLDVRRDRSLRYVEVRCDGNGGLIFRLCHSDGT